MAVTCLFLACKIEENPIKVEHLVDKYMKLVSNKSASFDKVVVIIVIAVCVSSSLTRIRRRKNSVRK